MAPLVRLLSQDASSTYYASEHQYDSRTCVTPQMKADIAAYGLDRIPSIDALTCVVEAIEVTGN